MVLDAPQYSELVSFYQSGFQIHSMLWQMALHHLLCSRLVTHPATNSQALSRRQAAAPRRPAEERERRVREALAVTRELRAQQEEKARREAERAARQAAQATAGEAAPAKERPKEPRASTTDAQARIMKMADGGYRPAYNVQFASDTRSGAIAGVSVDTVGSDMGKMAPMNEALAADYGQRP